MIEAIDLNLWCDCDAIIRVIDRYHLEWCCGSFDGKLNAFRIQLGGAFHTTRSILKEPRLRKPDNFADPGAHYSVPARLGQLDYKPHSVHRGARCRT